MRGRTQRVKILVVDDDPQLLRLLVWNLQMEGYAVLTASDGRQALEQIAANPPDLILLDVILPGPGGFQVCQRVRECSVVPIMCLTARGGDQEKGRLLELGADECVTKPFDITALLARIQTVFHARLTPLTLGEVLRFLCRLDDRGPSQHSFNGSQIPQKALSLAILESGGIKGGQDAHARRGLWFSLFSLVK